MNITTGVIDHEARTLELNDIGRMTLRLAAPIAADPYDSGASTGRLIIIDEVVPEGNAQHFGKFEDIVMMSLLTGQVRTEAQFVSLFERAGLKNLERQVKDPVKREKLTPAYEFGCKRMLMSNTYYKALDRPNADVVTEPIASVGPRSITAEDGTTREADVIIYGTGFDTQAMASSVEITGEGGQVLAELWQREGIQAHRGTMISGFKQKAADLAELPFKSRN